MYHKIAHFNRINEDDITAINSFFLRQEVTQNTKMSIITTTEHKISQLEEEIHILTKMYIS